MNETDGFRMAIKLSKQETGIQDNEEEEEESDEEEEIGQSKF